MHRADRKLSLALLLSLAAVPAVALAQEAPEGAPAAVPASTKDEPPTVSATYDKGFAFVSSDDRFELKLALRSQFRFEVIRPTDDGEEFHNRFSVPRLRLQLEGFLYGKVLAYKVEFGMDEKGASFTKDFFVDKAWDALHVRLGQWKRPFNRQELVSDFSSVFNERANVAEFVGGGRDMGVAVHNNYEKSPEGLEWVVGVFNTANGGKDRPSSSATTTCTEDPLTMEITCTTTGGSVSNVPDDFGPALVARVGWNSGKIKGYSEGDLEGGPLRLAVAANYKVDLADLQGDDMGHTVGADVMVKAQGFDAIAGVFLSITKKPVMGDRDNLLSAFAQAGYFLAPKKVQVAARFAFVPAKSDPTNEKELEIRGALNWYFHGHTWKLATDAGIVQETTEGAKARFELRSMAQLTF